ELLLDELVVCRAGLLLGGERLGLRLPLGADAPVGDGERGAPQLDVPELVRLRVAVRELAHGRTPVERGGLWLTVVIPCGRPRCTLRRGEFANPLPPSDRPPATPRFRRPSDDSDRSPAVRGGGDRGRRPGPPPPRP